ncbi:MAG: hypothetical protein HYR70_08045 [Chloroflexi bacterium]|nr:hypothetical protein [Chloroflexota bacterium]MBI3339219.1 hypothetical protein [Chloroflexota bacterium]
MSTPMHNCSYCNQLVPDGNPYCGKCGGPQVYKPKGSAVGLQLDPWIITAPSAKQQFQGDNEAVRALVNTWRNDTDHGRTREIQQQIDEALSSGSLTRNDSYYYCCPWSPIYSVNRDLKIGDTRLKRGQQFTLDISAEEIPRGGAFKRAILVGDFGATDNIDYCLPDDKN